jgi:hypothetical protein
MWEDLLPEGAALCLQVTESGTDEDRKIPEGWVLFGLLLSPEFADLGANAPDLFGESNVTMFVARQ